MATISSDSPAPAKLRRPAPKQPSRAFIGQSISAQLQNSSFGQFNAYLRDIKAHLPSVDFKLPRVIVVGGKSAGKSSLLEMITKCPIFPRHSDFCTKMPIKLQLKRVSTTAHNTVSLTFQGKSTKLELAEILPEIDKIMQEVEHAVAEPIVVEICKDDVSDFEFVDLPGIQTFPEEQYRHTSELVRTYLSGADTLVLCVVDATAPALDGTLAVKMVRDAGKLSNTILALTKSDLVTTEIGQVENIFDRLLRHSAEMQHLEGLAGCVAVASRDYTDSISLVEADALEQQLFQKMLLDPADAFAPQQVQEQLRQCMGSQQLIFRLDQMFHDYIVQHWKPVALQTLQDVIDKTYIHIHQLGLPRHLYEALKRQPFKLPDDFILTEDQDVQTKRAALQSTVLKLRTAHDQLSNIEGVFGGAAAGQMASVPDAMHNPTAPVIWTSCANEGDGQPTHMMPVSPASTESIHSAAVIAADVDGQPVSPVVSVSEGFVHVD
ncbi:hypothetical protein WJX77_006117 [Trebouxia sp. C0004]